MIEVPLLFETGMEGRVRRGDLRDRAAASCAPSAPTGAGSSELEGRDGRQLPEGEKAARSDFVVANDGTLQELEAKLEALLPELKSAGR